MSKDKATDKELRGFMDMMDKKFGERSLVEFEDGVASVSAISSGLLSLDNALGIGGFPRGRIVEIYGGEASGKTTLAIKCAVECQRRKGQLPIMIAYKDEKEKRLTGRVGFLDVEHAFNPEYAKMHGLDLSKGSGFVFDQPMSGVEAMQKLEYMIDSNLFDLVIVDSVAGLTTLDEDNKDIGQQVIAGTAQLMSSGLKKLKGKISQSRTVVIFINQIRDKPAVMFGSPETTTGGRALKFYSSIRIRVSRAESISKGTNKIGHQMKIMINKNKVAPPYKSTIIDLNYEEGFDTFKDMIGVSTALGVVELRGSSYVFVSRVTGEIHKASGKVKWQEYLQENPEVYAEIEKHVMEGGFNDGNQEAEQE